MWYTAVLHFQTQQEMEQELGQEMVANADTSKQLFCS